MPGVSGVATRDVTNLLKGLSLHAELEKPRSDKFHLTGNVAPGLSIVGHYIRVAILHFDVFSSAPVKIYSRHTNSLHKQKFKHSRQKVECT